uniref:Uncharacterized protein n=1 Tax=Anguilla anguilla TaxID=7936 RepID=A0A0E9R6P7_ANGAN
MEGGAVYPSTLFTKGKPRSACNIWRSFNIRSIVTEQTDF